MNNFKKCIRCNVNKSFDDYYNDKANKLHGKKNCCIECEKKDKREKKDLLKRLKHEIKEYPKDARDFNKTVQHHTTIEPSTELNNNFW